MAALASALSRVAAVTSVIRTRCEDGAREDRHGDQVEREKRIDETVERLEAVAARLESLVK